MIMAPFYCQLCAKTFPTVEKFTMHSYSHARDRPFKCTQAECGKAFVSKYKLMRHMATHSPNKIHKCAHCEKTFNRKDHLKNHLQTHNPNKVAFECEECGKKYHTTLGYKRHLAMHAAHSGDLTCGVCSLELGSTDQLLNHLKTHAEEKPPSATREKKHQCDHCDRCFYTRKDVRRHLVVHTGCKDFLCQFCAQRFGRKDHLTRHTKKTHSQELLRESLKAADFMSTFQQMTPPFQLKAAPMSPFPIAAPAQNGLVGSLPAEGHGLALSPQEHTAQPMPLLAEVLAPIHAVVAPSSPPPTFQNHKYNTGSTSYPPLTNLPLKADTKVFCNLNLFEELPLPEPQSPPKLNPTFELVKGEVGKVELPIDAVNLAIPASLDISTLLSFWQLPPPPTSNGFGNNPLPMGSGEPLPHRLGCLGQQQPEAPIAVSTVNLGQLPLPPIPHVFTTGTNTAILPHFHHAFR